MTLAAPTLDEIRDGYLTDLRLEIDDADTEEGGHHYATAVALANALAPVYANAQFLQRQAFETTADETGLQVLAKRYGVPRRTGTKAIGTATVTTSFAQTIAAGATLSNEATGARYRTTTTTRVTASLTATANIEAIEPGANGNAVAGTILKFESPPAGVNPRATVLELDGGEAEWSIARWRSEINKKRRRRQGAGSVGHIQSLAVEVPGVEECFVYPALRGPGTNDVVVTTSAASGSRVAGTSLINRVIGVLQYGTQVEGGDFIAGLPPDVLANTRVHAAVEEPVGVFVGYKASAQNPFASWPPYGPGYVELADENSWYAISASTSLTSFTIAVPAAGTPETPSVGDQIGVFFPSKGFCRATVETVSGAGPWVVTVDAWVASDAESPTEDVAPVGAVVTPWCSQLTGIAGAPTDDTGEALSGAVPEYFAGLGPGEMTALTSDDLSRRCRWPKVGEVNPFTGLAYWPTDITARLSLAAHTDATNFSISASRSTPSVPEAAFIGTPPLLLTLQALKVIPVP